MEAIFSFIFLAVVIFGFMLMYKKRLHIARWLGESSMSVQLNPKHRRKYLSRRIEDAQDELAELDEIEK